MLKLHFSSLQECCPLAEQGKRLPLFDYRTRYFKYYTSQSASLIKPKKAIPLKNRTHLD
ncbi:hypothetical protein [Metabacillus sediminilitoris]|uniref:hypothetical protein n=1 Tax=Metabacillus sediminilitoris TaxID=2567941 RepID=UPI001454D19E|nr:hypothetical protein [Metabacillus sediminilitoris]